MTSQTRHFRPRDYKFKERSNQRAIEPPLPLYLARSISSVELDGARNLASIERQSRQTGTQSRGHVESCNDDNKIFREEFAVRQVETRNLSLSAFRRLFCSLRTCFASAAAALKHWTRRKTTASAGASTIVVFSRIESQLSRDGDVAKEATTTSRAFRRAVASRQLWKREWVRLEMRVLRHADTAAPVTSTMRNIRSIIYFQSVKFDASIVIT